MAKLGEGDARWIVADRQDGTNVHNWHWAEKDVLPWSKSRLTELLGTRPLHRTMSAAKQRMTQNTAHTRSANNGASALALTCCTCASRWSFKFHLRRELEEAVCALPKRLGGVEHLKYRTDHPEVGA